MHPRIAPQVGFLRSNARCAISRLLPASFPGRSTALAAVARIAESVHRSDSPSQAAQSLDHARPHLLEALRQRFPPVEAAALTVKILNLFLAGCHHRARSTTVLSHPFGLVIDPSNACRLACPGCVHSAAAGRGSPAVWPGGAMTEARLDTLLRQYGAAAIGAYFCNYGEPLLNRNTPRLIRMAKGYLLWTALSTTLSVRSFDAEAYVRSGLDVMVVSVDGVTQDVYEKFRRGGDLQVALDNISRLVEAKRRLGKRTPLLSWNFLAFRHNQHQVQAAEGMARELGMNCFRLVRPFDVSRDDDAIAPAPMLPYWKRLDLASASCAGENWSAHPDPLAADRILSACAAPFPAAPDEAPSPGPTCDWLYQNVVVDAKGRVLPCCGAPPPATRLVFADLDSDPADPFNKAAYREARSVFRDGGPPGTTVHCAACEWDRRTVNIGEAEIRRYFRAVDPWYFDRRSTHLLSAAAAGR